MNENKNRAEDMIRNIEDEASEIVEKIEKEFLEEVEDQIEDTIVDQRVEEDIGRY